MIDREIQLKALFLQGQEGNAKAYSDCLTALSGFLRAFLRKRLSQRPDDVEDLVQEVLLAIHNQRHTFDVSQPLTAWAYAITRFKLIDFFRRKGTQGHHVDIDDVEADLSYEEQPAQDAKRDVIRLLDELPQKQREAIQWVKIEGLSIAEAARETGQSESSIKVGIHRGLKALAQRMRVCE